MVTTKDKAECGPGPEIVRRGERLVARFRIAKETRTEIDVARLIEEERNRSFQPPAP